MSSEARSAGPGHQYVVIYCHGEKRLALYLGDGWFECGCCHHKFQGVITPELVEPLKVAA